MMVDPAGTTSLMACANPVNAIACAEAGILRGAVSGASTGALIGGAENLAEQAMNDCPFDFGELASSMAVGAAVGAVGGAIGGKVAGSLAKRKAAKTASEAFQKQSAAVDNLVGELTYANRANASLKIPGGVAGAIRHTKNTGELVGGSDHIQKGRDILGKLRKIRKRINNSHGMNNSERTSLLNTVNQHIDDLTDALK